MPFVEDDTWDAGSLSCGELAIALRNRLRAMPGCTLKLVTTDAGAPSDIPAYCRLTGHELLGRQGHAYWIRARAA